MTSRVRHLLLVLVSLVATGFAPLLEAQQPAPPSPAASVTLPPMPSVISPVDVFRKLLAMTPGERELQLSKRPPEIRKRILAKLQEYAAMKPDDRDSRLRVTELRWFLLSLMNQPPVMRTNTLAAVPDAERQPIIDRLQQWDKLPADEQKDILKYEKSMEQFVDQSLTHHLAATNILNRPLPPMPPGTLKSLDNFLQLPPEQRQQMYASFQRFFELTDAEKQKAVGLLPDTQREQMAALLRSFKDLPPADRAERFHALARLSSMSDADRAEFMKKAERWRELSPAERDAWRSLVHRLPPSPPLPPGMIFPPMPPRSAMQASTVEVTNSSP